MLIGGDFNEKGKALLKELFRMSGGDTKSQVKVQDLNSVLDYERNEVKNLLEYLQDKDLAKIETIGGPFLYGHITISPKGIKKVLKMK